MDNALLLILSIIGLLALYWVLFGQWNYNKMIREAEKKPEIVSSKRNEKKPTNKTK